MNTFLPVSDFQKSARCLDKRRCFKQVVETYQILNILDGKSKGWIHHPAVRMWVGYRDCLQYYYNVFYYYCEGHHKIKFDKLPKPELLMPGFAIPKWLGYPAFHFSMAANLVRKVHEDKEKGRDELGTALFLNYSTDYNGIQPQQGYLWPVDKSGNLLLEIQEWYENKEKEKESKSNQV